MVNALVRDDALGVRITWPSALFTTAEIEELAAHLRTALLHTAAAPEILALDRDRAAEVQPLTPLQEVMLRHSRTERPDPYTVQSAFTLAGTLDPDALRAAGADLLTRHPNLGAVFPAGLAVIPEAPRPEFRVTDSPADEVLAADLAEPFDLAAGPLLRLTVIRRGPDLADLVLTSHHVLSDGWSAPGSSPSCSPCTPPASAARPPNCPPPCRSPTICAGAPTTNPTSTPGPPN